MIWICTRNHVLFFWYKKLVNTENLQKTIRFVASYGYLSLLVMWEVYISNWCCFWFEGFGGESGVGVIVCRWLCDDNGAACFTSTVVGAPKISHGMCVPSSSPPSFHIILYFWFEQKLNNKIGYGRWEIVGISLSLGWIRRDIDRHSWSLDACAVMFAGLFRWMTLTIHQ